MSHELRTPLNAIIGFSALLKSQDCGELSEENLRFASYAHDSGEGLLSIINDLLDLSKIETHHMTLQFERLDPVDLAMKVIQMLDRPAQAKGLDVSLEAPGELGFILADRGKISQVLSNLLSNAIKFSSEEGSIRVSVDGSDATVQFRVSSEPGAGSVLSFVIPSDGAAADDQEPTEGEGFKKEASLPTSPTQSQSITFSAGGTP